MLNVRTGDVKEGHGAAMAPVSPDELFYLGSRGIEDAEGRRMIISGFLREAFLASKPGNGIGEEVQRRIAGKLGELDGI
jgi:Fe-S cluster assembly scaffold protein SufB